MTKDSYPDKMRSEAHLRAKTIRKRKPYLLKEEALAQAVLEIFWEREKKVLNGESHG